MKKIITMFAILFSFSIGIFAQSDSSLKITFQPTPEIPEKLKNNGTFSFQGTITLRVEFMSDGLIGKVFPVNGLPYGLTEKTVEAAKKIKFEPETKANNPITVNKIITYFYNWDDGWKVGQNKWNTLFTDEKAETIVKTAYQKIGGDRFLQIQTQVSSGFFTIIVEGANQLPSSFIDVIAFPDKERTEFKQQGNKVIQTNSGDKGWVYDGATMVIREQGQNEIDNFKRGLRTGLDALFRGKWRNQGGTLTYVGKREAGLGKRNEVVKLTYSDGFIVEYEFSQSDGMPMKSIYKKNEDDGTEIKEEDRFAQFVEVQGVLVPFILDHFTNGKQTSRVNYEKIEFNKNIPSSIFDKPSDPKQLKKDLKF
ncbi:MAG: energy transducer TonB [Pyrinomonadaceae bacterium]|nr:energy transducer TonB [Pyrinomonadaceae bacterium]